MRKYQQLMLVVISVISISILLMYKSENNRLKYVLQVVNFFGRNDASILSRLENGTASKLSGLENYHEYSIPLPVWQLIGEHFHLYSCFWNKKELMAGGEAIGIVIGAPGAIINFKCSLRYDNGKTINGKFAFVRSAYNNFINNEIPNDDINTNKKIRKLNFNETFTIFKFLCKVTRDFGTPEAVIFTESKSKRISNEIALKVIHTPKEIKNKSLITVCLNLIPTNQFTLQFLSKQYLLQFFIHHQTIGVDEFIVYDSNRISSSVRRILSKIGVQINYLPFNFPYGYNLSNSALNNNIEIQLSEIIENDCLIRNINTAKFTTVLRPNEFILPNTNLQFKDSILYSLNHYDNDIVRFQLPLFFICLNSNNKLLLDNRLYDPELKTNYKLYIYRPTIQQLWNFNSDDNNNNKIKSVSLSISQILSHHYINCSTSTDNKEDKLYDWHNSVREDFLQYIMTIRNEISFIF